ncbi:MAG: nucleotide exchange factor GrpE [Mycoplasmataceae bacterium]|jgi:molecular chaperone GrpE|nr:nucleotide exchange factor GrpE [Mycoplasmataceae bacterium]
MSKNRNKEDKSTEKELKHNQEDKSVEKEKTEETKTAKSEKTADQLIIEQLQLNIQELKEIITSKNEHINKLESEIKTINEDYVKKVMEKASDANIQLKTKLDELTKKMQAELAIHEKYALEKQAGNLIDIINQFAIALSYKPTDPNIAKYQSGFQMFLTMFQNLLSDLNINEIPIKIGDEFDSETMECIEFVHSNDFDNNKVVKIISRGYKLHDRLIKPAMVNVVRKAN